MMSQAPKETIPKISADVQSLLKELERLGEQCRTIERTCQESALKTTGNTITVKGR